MKAIGVGCFWFAAVGGEPEDYKQFSPADHIANIQRALEGVENISNLRVVKKGDRYSVRAANGQSRVHARGGALLPEVAGPMTSSAASPRFYLEGKRGLRFTQPTLQRRSSPPSQQLSGRRTRAHVFPRKPARPLCDLAFGRSQLDGSPRDRAALRALNFPLR